MDSFIIDDGYEQSAFVAAFPNVHPELRFTFRPMLSEEREKIGDSMGRLNAAQRHTAMVGAIVARIKSWSAKDKDGKPLPVDANSVRLLKPKLFDRLDRIITGIEGGDQDPEQSPEAYNADADAELQAAIQGRLAADVKEAADAKN